MMDEQNLPIDIHTSKLVDWLVSRRHVKKNWPECLQVIREKIKSAILDMPEHPVVTKLLSGAYINYFHCVKIEQILQETEKDSKNIFGWYTSQRMKDWREIIKLYESNNVYLAEISQYLVRNVTFEVPYIRRQLGKCKQVQEDCDRREAECNKNATLTRDRYYSTCKKIGLIGDNVKYELMGLLTDLPKDFTRIAESTASLKEAREFYSDFLSFALPEQSSVCLPLLKFVMDRGDATTYEWKHGEPPTSVELPAVQTKEPRQSQNEEIDFGEDADVIDFGDEIELTTGDIDWGGLQNEEKIDWNIDVAEADDDGFQIVVESSGIQGGVAKGNEALTVLHTESTRSQFINELLELEGFLSQRELELKLEESILSMTQFSSAPRRLQYQNEETILAYLKDLRCILQELNSTKMMHLYLISTSPRYVDRLAKSLTDRLKDSEKFLSMIDSVQKKRTGSIELQHTLTMQLDAIIARTRDLQNNIEEQISLKYNNRPVNLMGGINVL